MLHPAFANIYEFFRMGGYAFYVWMSYACLLVTMAINILLPLRRYYKTKQIWLKKISNNLRAKD